MSVIDIVVPIVLFVFVADFVVQVFFGGPPSEGEYDPDHHHHPHGH